jgi:hypothetical protein
VNKTNLRKVYKAIKHAPPDRFCYSQYFGSRYRDVSTTDVVPDVSCGTAGCVAGWTAMIFAPGDPFLTGDQLDELCSSHLGLDDNEAHFLFHEKWELATRDDALARLHHLIEYGTESGYDWTKESWYDAALEATKEP